MSAENYDIQDVRCPSCGYFTTTEELEWDANFTPVKCFCPECGYEFETLPETPMKETEQTLLDQIKNDVAKGNGWNSTEFKFIPACKEKDAMWDIICERYATVKAQASCEATPVSTPYESQEELWIDVSNVFTVAGHGDAAHNHLLRRFTITRKPE